jgi:photosystem II stability/assembly factor-like uncharacterized protein
MASHGGTRAGDCRRTATRALAGLLMAAGCVAVGAEVEDVLTRASTVSAKAGQAVMLAVARAGDRFVAVGERGIVLVSDGAARQWTQVGTPVSVTLTAVHFPDANNGFAAGHGGVVLGTRDGGTTWQRLLDGRQAAERSVADGPDKPLLDVHFRNARNGLAVGAFGMAMATEDGGNSWRPLDERIPNGKHSHLYRIIAYKDLLWLVGEQGALFLSRDGGAAFEPLRLPYAGTLFGLVAVSEREWVVYGLRGNVFRTADAGGSWHKLPNPEGATLTHGQALRDGRVVLVDQGGKVLVMSADGASLKPWAGEGLPAINAVAEAVDGALVLATLRGMHRVAISPAAKS